MKIIKASQPICRPVNRTLSVTESITEYVFEYKGKTYKLLAPDGFFFDGASIPRVVWSILGLAPHGVMNGPSLPHDLCYHYRGEMPPGSYFVLEYDEWIECVWPMPKKMSDALLRALCVYFGACGKFKAYLIWKSVSWFGGFAWRSDDKERKELKILQELGENNG